MDSYGSERVKPSLGTRGLAASVAPCKRPAVTGPTALPDPGLRPSRPPAPVWSLRRKEAAQWVCQDRFPDRTAGPLSQLQAGARMNLPLELEEVPAAPGASRGGTVRVSVVHVCVPRGGCTYVCKRAHAHSTCSILTGHVAHVCKCACVCCVRCLSVHGMCLRVCVCDCT